MWLIYAVDESTNLNLGVLQGHPNWDADSPGIQSSIYVQTNNLHAQTTVHGDWLQ